MNKSYLNVLFGNMNILMNNCINLSTPIVKPCFRKLYKFYDIEIFIYTFHKIQKNNNKKR